MLTAARIHGVRSHLYALLGYSILALVVTYPTILHFTTQIPGELLPDRNQDYWNFWWITQAFSRGVDPFYTDALYYPYGAPLYYHILGLPQWFIGLVPLLLWGYSAANNTVIFASFILSGYGAFRLALMFTGRPLASFLGGIIYGYTPYMLASVSIWQNANTSIQWLPFYAEAWLRAWQDHSALRWRPLIVAGAMFSIATYTSLYYSVQFLFFTAVHLGYIFLSRGWRQWQSLRHNLAQAAVALAVMGGVALVLTLPLAVGLAQHYNNPRIELSAENVMVEHSADLLSFIALPHDHPLLGGNGGRFGTDRQAVDNNLTLGWVALSLAVGGAVVARRRKEMSTPFWVALGVASILLSMGPELKVASHHTGIPLPFALVSGLPIAEAAGKLYRMAPLIRCAMAVLGAWGAAWLIDWLVTRLHSPKQADPTPTPSNTKSHLDANTPPALSPQPSVLITNDRSPQPATRIQQFHTGLSFAFILSLLLFELPLHPRYGEPFNVPSGFKQLADMPPGGLMELPYAKRQSLPISERMIYQTVHGHPIMSGYISRRYNSPIDDPCSPFAAFLSPDPLRNERDIASPLVSEHPAEVLSFYRIPYLALYTRFSMDGPPQPPELLDSKREIISQVGAGSPFYNDDYVSLYTVPPRDLSSAPLTLAIGAGWYEPERESDDTTYRWLKEGRATLCIFAPRAVAKQRLAMESTAFVSARNMVITSGDATIFSGTVPFGNLLPVLTDPFDLQPGMNEITISAPEPGVSPNSLDANSGDSRSLTVNFRNIRLSADNPAGNAP
jgi:hypothetical protein